MIDFESAESHLLLNPRLPPADRARLEGMVPSRPAHIYVATSGSTGDMKLVALSKRAVLASARSVNARLGASSADVWCNVLPEFHVGGLGIFARSFLAGSRVVRLDSWDARAAIALMKRAGVTLISLVPTQLHDLVRADAAAPVGLRVALIGGGRLEAPLERRARELGWPLLASYGSTECASTIATGGEDGVYELLDHLEASERDGRLAFRGSSLLTGYCGQGGSMTDPKVDGWFVSEDRGTSTGRLIRVEGRGADFIKIGGESVDLGRLDRIAAEVGGTALAVVAVPDARLGFLIELVLEGEGSAEAVAAFNERVLPFERARRLHRVAVIPRSPLGKVMRGKLLAFVSGDAAGLGRTDRDLLE